MDENMRNTLVEVMLDEQKFVRAVFSRQQRGAQLQWEKLTIRPVAIKSGRALQFTYLDGKQAFTYNYLFPDEARNAVHTALELPFRYVQVQTVDEVIEARATKRGRFLMSRTRITEPVSVDMAHDRAKKVMIAPDEATSPFLQAIGILSNNGRVKAGMQNKYRQINKFLELLEGAGVLTHMPDDRPVRVVDAGCGNAYLTFALYYYLTQLKGRDSALTGIDTNGQLMTGNHRKAESLGWDGLTFEETAIIDYAPAEPPDMTIALHACDTATDDAIAQGVRWGSTAIICAPCCHHDLQVQLSQQETPELFLPVLRHGILHERVGDLLTDTFRALILRIMGYRTDIVQFVEAEHTPKNLMIRAVKTAPAGDERAIAEYRALREYWKVTPHLETLLAPQLSPYLDAAGG